jgi:hypothetical protein
MLAGTPYDPPDWYKELLEDVITSDKMVKENDSQYTRRVFLRDLFSLLEANLHMTRRILARRISILFQAEGYTILPILALLMDQSPEFADGGKHIRLRHQSGDILTLTRFIVKLYAYLANVSKDYFGVQGWESFKNMVRIRNRITHPKSGEDIHISNDDLAAIRAANAWFKTTFEDILLTELKAQVEQEKARTQPAESEIWLAFLIKSEEQRKERARRMWEAFMREPFPLD